MFLRARPSGVTTLHNLGAELRVFRASPKALLSICAFAGVGGGIPIAIRRLMAADEVTLGMVAIVALAIPAASLLAFVLFSPFLRLVKVRVHGLGIRGHDAIGRRAEVTWPQIRSVTPLPLLTLTFMKLEVTGVERTVWLPVFLTDRPVFDAMVAELAGESHPLTQALESDAE